MTALGTATATELDATNAKGWYSFVLTQAETNADALLFTAKSTTANAYIVGQLIYTNPPNFSALSLNSSGQVDVIKLNGTSQTARDIGASVITASGTVTTVTNQLTAAQIATGVWTDTTAGDFTTALSVGKSVMNGVTLGTGLTVASVSGAVGSVAGLTASNLDATISSRMATYTQPTGFLAATFPTGTIANTTNITAGTITTATNLTTYTGNTPQTGDAYARLGAPAGASHAADVAAVKVDTAAVKVQTDKMTFTVANQIDANVLSLNGDATSAANIAKTTKAIGRGTVSGSPSTTSIPTSACSPSGAVADQFKGRIITFDAATATTALRGQATDITASSNSATPTFTVTALTTAPASGDTFSIT